MPQLLIGIQYAIKKLPANQGLMVFVKLSRLLKMFMDFGKQISVDITRYAYAVETMAEAYQLLAEKSHVFDQKA